MRLTQQQIEAIRQSATETFGADAAVWLFGSRTNENKRGGDIDLLVAPHAADHARELERKLRFLGLLERRMGERKIDVVIERPDDPRAIVRIARATGVRLQ